MPEEEVSKRVLPDHLTNNLDIIIVSEFSINLERYTILLKSALFFNENSKTGLKKKSQKQTKFLCMREKKQTNFTRLNSLNA